MFLKNKFLEYFFKISFLFQAIRDNLQQLLNQQLAFSALRDQLHRDLTESRDQLRDSSISEATLDQLSDRIRALDDLRQRASDFDMKLDDLRQSADSLSSGPFGAKAKDKTAKAEKDVNAYKAELEERYSDLVNLRDGRNDVEEKWRILTQAVDETETEATKLKSRPLDANVELIGSVIDEWKVCF